MIDAVFRSLPIRLYDPLRWTVARLRRGHPLRSASVLVLQRASRAHRAHLAARLTEVRPIDAPHLTFQPVNSMVMDAVYWLGVGGYEGRVSDIWTTLCRDAGSILEIGGNVGLFTVLGATATRGRYSVVEPVPEVAAVLRANLKGNRLADRVEVLEAAVIPNSQEHEVVLNIPHEGGRDAPVGAHLVEGVEVGGRGTLRQLRVRGLPIAGLAEGRDLIKIDAEGIENELLGAIHDLLVRTRPTLLIEVLPEAIRLGERLAALAREAGYLIHVVPEYGSDTIVTVPPEEFSSEVPRRHNSKDVVLSTRQLT